MARILLVNPHSSPPVDSDERVITLPLLYISSYLKQFGHEVLFIDLYNEQRMEYTNGNVFDMESLFSSKYYKQILDFNPDIAGVTVHYSGRFFPAIEFIQLFNNYFPDISCVIGGIYPTLFSEEILSRYEPVDFILKGESEETFLQLIDCLNNKSGSLKEIDGLTYRINDKIINNEKKNFISNLDLIPFPDYDLIDIKEYFFDTSEWYNPKQYPININIPILTTRSCPNQCTYCSMYKVHGRGFRKRSVNNVVDEIEYLYNKFNLKYFSFTDDNLTFDKGRIIKICSEIVNRGIEIQFDTPNGLDMNRLDSDVISALVGAGLVKTSLAVESGSPKIRKSINKYLEQEKIYEVVDAVRKYPELKFSLLFVIGFPEDTLETLDETYNLIKELGIDKFSMNYAVPYPGTKLFHECKDNKLIELSTAVFLNIPNLSHHTKVPFIKPYKLEKEDLIDFREKCMELHK